MDNLKTRLLQAGRYEKPRESFIFGRINSQGFKFPHNPKNEVMREYSYIRLMAYTSQPKSRQQVMKLHRRSVGVLL